MKKIGILTYHHVANWGSVLQAACLYKLLARIYPHAKVEVIDYVPETSNRYNALNLYSRRKRFGFNYMVKNTNFDNKIRKCQLFLNKHVVLSPNRLISDDLQLGRRFIEKQKYDLVFVGSDTIFQMGPYAENRYIGAPQAPNLYFLPFKSSFKKIGFAVSVDPFREEQLKSLDVGQLSYMLNDFDQIFYRDGTTEGLLKRLKVSEKKLDYIADPSLLVDFDLFCDNKYDNEPRGGNLVGIAIGNPQLASKMAQAARQLNYIPIDFMGGLPNNLATSIKVGSVENFIAIHRKMNLVITDRFHGSIKTLLVGNCPVIGIEEAKKYPLKNSKLRDLYMRFGIEEMLVRYDDEDIEPEWIQSMLQRWKYSRLDILAAVQHLRSDAVNVLRKIRVTN